MHLLAATAGADPDGLEAVDLQQTPGDVVILTAADTELAALSMAYGAVIDPPFTVRLANWMQLAHHMSVDLYVEDVIQHSRLVIVRVLGGAGYWRYGLSRVADVCRQRRVDLVVIPGDDQPDPELAAFSTTSAELQTLFWQYFTHGGPQNMQALLATAAHHIGCGHGAPPPPPKALMAAGLYWPQAQASDPSIINVADLATVWQANAPVVAVVFYRTLLQGGSTAPIDALITALQQQDLNPLPLYVSSLKEDLSAALLVNVFDQTAPAVILNATGFAVSRPGHAVDSPLDGPGVPVLQVVFAGATREVWLDSARGLGSRDLAMNVALPEVDGRVLSRAVSFKSEARWDAATQMRVVTYQPEPDRVAYVAALAHGWVRLARTPVAERRVALVLANYPNRDGRLGNGVGLDTPASTAGVVQALQAEGYHAPAAPTSADALMTVMLSGPSNDLRRMREGGVCWPVDEYQAWFATLPDPVQQAVSDRWGAPSDDPFVVAGAFRLAIHCWGHVCVGVQPARGYNIDPKATYHDPDLVPPHGYLAFYGWLRSVWNVHALVHMGKHGNAEWLPGKALALSATCFPEVVQGPVPHIYPFIVNDPGEGTQAKRRMSAVIIDHLTPPLTRAESYGPLRDLEALVDEYYQAAGVDPRRLDYLRTQILELAALIGLDQDCGISEQDDAEAALGKLDAYLCELKEMQIRDGLHVFGASPTGSLAHQTAVALVRTPRDGPRRTDEDYRDESLHRALALDLVLDPDFDPLACEMAAPWTGHRPQVLQDVTADLWRTAGDTVERLELLASQLVAGDMPCAEDWPRTRHVLDHVRTEVLPTLAACGSLETAGLLTALDGRFVQPGPSGAPTRGRLDVLPTGRNFFSVDNRTVPTQAAWALGWKSAGLFVDTYRQDHGMWPRHVALSAWGTANMRTGGDDIAQALALMGARPVWEATSRRVTGVEIIPLVQLGRPRVDVTLRVSGFFRDAFPQQMALIDQAVRAIAARQDEGAEDNPIAARVATDTAHGIAAGLSAEQAARQAQYRVFGAKPGAYGAGLQALIDEGGWHSTQDFAAAFIAWGGYAYTGEADGLPAQEVLTQRLKGTEAVLHNQDNREHDLLDSDDYYQFEGGLAASITALRGERPASYHADHSRPERPVMRTLADEIGRVVRARAANPKWIAGVQRHGYKGAFELVATVDYLFAFAVTTGAVADHHFDQLFDAYLADPDVRAFMVAHNAPGLREMADRFAEAMVRKVWTPRRNSAHTLLRELGAHVETQETG